MHFIIHPEDKSLISLAISHLLYLSETNRFRWEIRPTLTNDGIDYMDLYIFVSGLGHRPEDLREVEVFFQMNWKQKGHFCTHCKEQTDVCGDRCGLGGDCGWYGATPSSCPAYQKLAVCGHLTFNKYIGS